jgi:hypothetical protein
MPVSEGKLITNSGISGFVSTTGNETISGSKTFTAGVTVRDASFTIQDDADNTKQAQFQLSGITAGTTRTYTLPNATTPLCGVGASHTITANWVFNTPIRFAGYTVATLPAAGTIGARSVAFVTDSTVTHAGNGGAIVAGGGANFCPVYSDGTNWRIL